LKEGEVSAVGNGRRAMIVSVDVSGGQIEKANAHHGAVRPPRK